MDELHGHYRTLFVIAIAASVLELLLSALTRLPGESHVSRPLVITLVLLAFPLWFAGLAAMFVSRAHHLLRGRRLVSYNPLRTVKALLRPTRGAATRRSGATSSAPRCA
ncbi:hypothetical protein [Yinghuangia seranimata]|uniref:hypothetical protein n=1 Tax=Yinghuangia seranimata TaxID=408067 RepID=UPI00248C43F4|nr:hypothetical protein [Yinghuangia seranimata]MDI2126394.1 hypothetical protein [Yinghuangia seranimata]